MHHNMLPDLEMVKTYPTCLDAGKGGHGHYNVMAERLTYQQRRQGKLKHDIDRSEERKTVRA